MSVGHPMSPHSRVRRSRGGVDFAKRTSALISLKFGRLAQLVEHFVYTEGVRGPSPLASIKFGLIVTKRYWT